jgi:hypothetical protein
MTKRDEFSTCAMAGCSKPKAKYSPWCADHTRKESKKRPVTKMLKLYEDAQEIRPETLIEVAWIFCFKIASWTRLDIQKSVRSR